MPEPDIEMEDIPDLGEVSDDEEEEDEPYAGEDAMEEGDQLFTATISCEAEFIHASSNILQHLAEAFHKNTQPKTFHKSVPTYLQDFEDLFMKSSFDHLPDWKVWDHAIELVPDSKASNCKVYPLALNKQVSNWTSSSRRTSRQGEFDHRNHPWRHPSSSSKRRMDHFISYRTTARSTPS
jgi:hypothetical protein